MLIGLAGVTSTGKTTMAAAIKHRYGRKVEILSKISRNDIFVYGNLSCPHDLTQATDKERAAFDMNRVKLQMKKEKELIKSINKPLIVDGCTIVKVAYLLYLSAPHVVQYFGEDALHQIVHDAIEHVDTYYSDIFYLPVERVPFKEADHRVFKSKWIRTSQDAILRRLINEEIDDHITVEVFDSVDMNLVYDEFSKRGVQ